MDIRFEGRFSKITAVVLVRLQEFDGAKILVTVGIDLCEAAHHVDLLRVPLVAVLPRIMFFLQCLLETLIVFQYDGEENDWDGDGQKHCNHDDCNDGRFAQAALASFLAFCVVVVLSIGGGTSGVDRIHLLVSLVFNVCHIISKLFLFFIKILTTRLAFI